MPRFLFRRKNVPDQDRFWKVPPLPLPPSSFSSFSAAPTRDIMCGRCMLTTSLLLFFRQKNVKVGMSRPTLKPCSPRAWMLSVFVWSEESPAQTSATLALPPRHTTHVATDWLSTWFGHPFCISGLAPSMLSVCQEIYLFVARRRGHRGRVPRSIALEVREFTNLSFLGVVDLEAACGLGVHCGNSITFAWGEHHACCGCRGKR